MFYRKFYTNSNSSTMLKLYLAHIRPHLEYASAVWNPHLKGDIAEIERVQKFALRVCLKSWECDYDTLLSSAGLLTLESRRNKASLCHLYKIINELTDYPDAPITRQQFRYSSRSASSNALTVPNFRTSSRQNSFFPSTTTRWNGLPKELQNCTSLTTFKHLVTEHI